VKDVPVYLFTGFLEAGKTKFIQETLEERTLLLVCEEGEEEYAPDQFADKSVFIRVIEEQGQLTAENLSRYLKETKAERVVIEYNGMWMLDVLYGAMPEGWMVYQEFLFADAGTFIRYNNNMRQLVYDKLKSCELVVFNRFNGSMDKMEFHKIVRGASRRADIAYDRVQHIKEVLDDPQALENMYIVPMANKDGTVTKQPATPIRFALTEPTCIEDIAPTMDRQAPMVGEHSAEILREYGYSDADIERFLADKVITIEKL